MLRSMSSRREFLQSAAVATVAGSVVPYWFAGQAALAAESKSKNDRPLVGAIGVGGRGTGVALEASRFGDVVAVCDADRPNAERAKKAFGGKPQIYDDYRKLLERKDIEVVTNGTPDCFDNPDRFVATMTYPGDVPLLFLVVRDGKYLKSMKDGDISEAEDAELFAGVPEEWKKEQRNGIMFIGEQGRVFVNRGGVHGKPAEELKQNPLPAGAVKLYQSNNHMQNFFECVKSRKAPICPVDIGHRVITACHLGNVAMRLKRKIAWDPVKEEIVGDAEAANSIYVRREQRAPYRLEG